MVEDKIPRINITIFTVGLEADPATRGFSSEVQIEITKEEERNSFFFPSCSLGGFMSWKETFYETLPNPGPTGMQQRS